MAVVGTPTELTSPIAINPETGAGLGGLGPNGCVTFEAIRCFLLDTPEANILDNFEIKYTDKLLEQAVMAACSVYNVTSPLLRPVKFDGSDWPQNIPHLLILGAASWVLKITANEQLRNQFTSTDGNVPRVGVYDKFPQFLQYAKTLEQEFRDGVSHFKKLIDLEGSYRTSISPMSRRGGGWF